MTVAKFLKLKRRFFYFLHKLIYKLIYIKNIFKSKNTYITLITLTLILIFVFYPINKVQIYVKNKTLITDNQINQIKQLIKRYKFFLLNPLKIQTQISTNFYNIKHVDIRKDIPGHLTLAITETHYLGILHVGKKQFLLTEENKLITLDNNIKQKKFIKTLPHIYSNTYTDIFLDNLHELIQLYNNLILRNDTIKSIQIHKLYIQKIYNNISLTQIPTIKIKTQDYTFLISPSKDLKKQIIILKILLTNPTLQNIKIKIIDLRFDRPVIK